MSSGDEGPVTGYTDAPPRALCLVINPGDDAEDRGGSGEDAPEGAPLLVGVNWARMKTRSEKRKERRAQARAAEAERAWIQSMERAMEEQEHLRLQIQATQESASQQSHAPQAFARQMNSLLSPFVGFAGILLGANNPAELSTLGPALSDLEQQREMQRLHRQQRRLLRRAAAEALRANQALEELNSTIQRDLASSSSSASRGGGVSASPPNTMSTNTMSTTTNNPPTIASQGGVSASPTNTMSTNAVSTSTLSPPTTTPSTIATNNTNNTLPGGSHALGDAGQQQQQQQQDQQEDQHHHHQQQQKQQHMQQQQAQQQQQQQWWLQREREHLLRQQALLQNARRSTSLDSASWAARSSVQRQQQPQQEQQQELMQRFCQAPPRSPDALLEGQPQQMPGRTPGQGGMSADGRPSAARQPNPFPSPRVSSHQPLRPRTASSSGSPHTLHPLAAPTAATLGVTNSSSTSDIAALSAAMASQQQLGHASAAQSPAPRLSTNGSTTTTTATTNPTSITGTYARSTPDLQSCLPGFSSNTGTHARTHTPSAVSPAFTPAHALEAHPKQSKPSHNIPNQQAKPGHTAGGAAHISPAERGRASANSNASVAAPNTTTPHTHPTHHQQHTPPLSHSRGLMPSADAHSARRASQHSASQHSTAGPPAVSWVEELSAANGAPLPPTTHSVPIFGSRVGEDSDAAQACCAGASGSSASSAEGATHPVPHRGSYSGGNQAQSSNHSSFSSNSGTAVCNAPQHTQGFAAGHVVSSDTLNLSARLPCLSQQVEEMRALVRARAQRASFDTPGSAYTGHASMPGHTRSSWSSSMTPSGSPYAVSPFASQPNTPPLTTPIPIPTTSTATPPAPHHHTSTQSSRTTPTATAVRPPSTHNHTNNSSHTHTHDVSNTSPPHLRRPSPSPPPVPTANTHAPAPTQNAYPVPTQNTHAPTPTQNPHAAHQRHVRSRRSTSSSGTSDSSAIALVHSNAPPMHSQQPVPCPPYTVTHSSHCSTPPAHSHGMHSNTPPLYGQQPMPSPPPAATHSSHSSTTPAHSHGTPALSAQDVLRSSVTPTPSPPGPNTHISHRSTTPAQAHSLPAHSVSSSESKLQELAAKQARLRELEQLLMQQAQQQQQQQQAPQQQQQQAQQQQAQLQQAQQQQQQQPNTPSAAVKARQPSGKLGGAKERVMLQDHLAREGSAGINSTGSSQLQELNSVTDIADDLLRELKEEGVSA